MQIAIIGAGNVGTALAANWVGKGHRIMFGVVDPARRERDATDPAITFADVATAAGAGEVVVLAVPWPAVPDAVAACRDLTGKIVLDATNPVAFGADGLDLTLGFVSSGGEEVAKMCPGAHVFKTLNQVGFKVMADPSGFSTKPVMFVAGDDAGTKPLVLDLVRDLGFDAIDAGPLRCARLLEPMAMLWMNQVLKHGASDECAFVFARKE